MNEDQAKQWLINNNFYTEADDLGEIPWAVLEVDQKHIEIVMAISKEIRDKNAEYFKKTDDEITELKRVLAQIGVGMR